VNEALHRVREVLEFRGVFENMVGAERNFSHHVDATYEGALTISPPIISIRSSGDIFLGKVMLRTASSTPITIDGLKVDGDLKPLPPDAIDLKEINKVFLARLSLPKELIPEVPKSLALVVRSSTEAISIPIVIQSE